MKKAFTIAILALVAYSSAALDVNLSKIDLEYTIESDTTVRASIDITWDTQSSSMQGFYLQVQNDTARFDQGNCFVRINSQDKLGVDITQINERRYDIDVENGVRFKGTATYHLEYETDPDRDIVDRMILYISGWDQTVVSQKITIITRDQVHQGDSLAELASRYYLHPNWDCEVVPIKIYTPEGTYLAFRIEEGPISLMAERSIVFARPSAETETNQTAFSK